MSGPSTRCIAISIHRTAYAIVWVEKCVDHIEHTCPHLEIGAKSISCCHNLYHIVRHMLEYGPSAPFLYQEHDSHTHYWERCSGIHQNNIVKKCNQSRSPSKFLLSCHMSALSKEIWRNDFQPHASSWDRHPKPRETCLDRVTKTHITKAHLTKREIPYQQLWISDPPSLDCNIKCLVLDGVRVILQTLTVLTIRYHGGCLGNWYDH